MRSADSVPGWEEKLPVDIRLRLATSAVCVTYLCVKWDALLNFTETL